MTETKAPSPIWDFLKTPWVGTVAIAIVTAIISGIGGLWTAGFFVKAARSEPPAIVKTVKTEPVPNPILETCQAAEQVLHIFRAEFHKRFPERKVRKAAGKK